VGAILRDMDDGSLVPDAGGLELAGLTVLLHRLASDQRLLLDGVASTIGTALPEAVHVRRSGLLNRGRAHTVEVMLGEECFELREQRGEVTSQVGRVVGGVVISHAPCSIDEWMSRLQRALQAAASRSADVRAALERIS